MESLFEMLEGRRSEDLTTQILAFVLRSSSFREFQKLFYEFLLKDGTFESTADRNYEVTSQLADEQGRPDLVIDGAPEILIAIENKFGAEFTGGDQLSRYVKFLNSAGCNKKLLVLLCPRKRQAVYERATVAMFRANATSIDEVKTFLSGDYGVTFVVITWDRLLELLDSESVLLGELRSFVTGRYLVDLNFSAEEVRKLMSKEIPDLLLRVFEGVERIRGELNGLHVVTPGRLGQSYNYYGFGVERSGWKFWFGSSLTHWKLFETPYVLQFISSPPECVERMALERRLGLTGFKLDEEGKWCFPIQPQAGVEVLALNIAATIRDKADELISSTAGILAVQAELSIGPNPM